MNGKCVDEHPKRQRGGTSLLLGLKELEKKIRDAYPELKDYPYVRFSDNYYLAKSFVEKFKENVQEKIDKQYGDDEPSPYYFLIKHPIFWAVSDYFPLNEDTYLILFFLKDEKKFDEIFLSLDKSVRVGIYQLESTGLGFSLEKLKVVMEKPPELNDDFFKKINDDINSFFSKESFYKENNITYKRGILLFGPPGNGKTTTVKYILDKNRDKYGIIIDCAKDFSRSGLDFVKNLIGDKKKIIVFEDIDGLDNYSRSSLLNFLDGLDELTNTFIIATTNNVSKVDYALINRPSRFDRYYFFDVPNEDARSRLLKMYFKKLSGDELESAVKATKDFSGAYFKELYLLTQLHECSLVDAIKEVKKQIKIFNSTSEQKEYTG